MSYKKQDIIDYRIEKSLKTFEEAKALAQNGFWNGAANRLYYSCFYIVIALLIKDNISVSTHNGVRTEFFKKYIKTGILDKGFSSLYSDLMSKRHEGDYDDFIEFTENEITPLIADVQNFIDKIKELIEK